MKDINKIEYSHETREALYAQWGASNLSKAAFCREKNISYNTFSYWHKGKASKKSENAHVFTHAKIGVQATRAQLPVGSLILPHGIRADIFCERTLVLLIKEVMVTL